MGAHSTITVSRDKAIAYLMQRLFAATDSELEDMLAIALDDRLYNASIREDGPDDYLLTV